MATTPAGASDGPKGKRKSAAPTDEKGLSGLNFSRSGTIDDEAKRELRGKAGQKIYRQMRDDEPIIGSIFSAIELLCRQVDWTVEPHPEGETEHAEFVESCMHDMSSSWNDFVSEALTMLWAGFAPHEVVYKRRQGPEPKGKAPKSQFNDGRIGWRKMPLRSQDTIERWIPDEEGGWAGLIQKAPPDLAEVEIPMDRLLLFRTTTARTNPEGRSVLRSAYRPWVFKKRFEEIEGTGIERDLAGFPKIWVDPAIMANDADPEDRAMLAQIEQMGRDMRRDSLEFLILPRIDNEAGKPLYDVELMTSGGKREFDISGTIQRYEQRMAMVLLGDFILLGHEKVGSFALSSDKTSLFSVAIGAYLDIIADILNRFELPRLFKYNGLPVDKLPRIVHGDIEAPDLTQLIGFVQGLQNAPDVATEQYLREQAHLPALAPEVIEEREAQEAFAREQAKKERELADQPLTPGTDPAAEVEQPEPPLPDEQPTDTPVANPEQPEEPLS